MGARDGAADDLLSYMEERFGIPGSALSRYTVIKRGRGYWLFSGDPNLMSAMGRVDSAGVRAARLDGGLIKPTTVLLRIVGQHATKNVVDLRDERDVLEFMGGGIVRGEFPVEPGFVIVRHGADVLGCGVYSSRLGVISQIPSYMRARSSWEAPEE